MMAELVFRPMQKCDIERVYELETVCFRTPWSRNALAGELKNSLAYYLVALVDEKVIGYAGMWILFDESHITNVAIDPEYRRKGYARALMLEMMKTALRHDASRMTLEVREHNTAAKSLYHSLGFEKAGVRKKYYTDSGEDAWIMWNNRIPAYIDTLKDTE